jgi:TonB family protein
MFHRNHFVASLTALGVALSASTDERPAREAQEHATGQWIISTERMSQRTVVSATLRAEAPVTVPSGEVTPTFIARCDEQDVEVLMHFGIAIDGKPPLRMWWDERDNLSYYWTASSDSESLISSDPLQFFAYGPWDARELRVEFRPLNSEPVVAKFSVSGLGRAMQRLVESCPTLAHRVTDHRSEPQLDLTWDPSLAPSPPVRVGSIPPPLKITHVPPIYPVEAMSARVQGVVMLQVFIDERGTVRDARVTRSIALLDGAALRSVREWVFTRTVVRGVVVPVVCTVAVEFKAP